ncbi:hypothetical protein B0H14DRAFT_3726189 [Mycena olivaceomarginata]|nr:hypothetical protein B0H14DRAFT_3726189 [Mycena olivaceomarginata]
MWQKSLSCGVSLERKIPCSRCISVNKGILAGLASATGAKKIAMNWVQYWKKIVLKRHVIIRRWPLEGHPRNPASIHDVESMRKLRDAWESGDCYWQKLNGDEQEEVKEMYEEMVASGEVEETVRKTCIDKGSSRKSQPSKALLTRSKAKDAPGRRVWEEDETTDEEGTRQKEKERRKAEKEKERRKAEKEKEKAKVKARKSEKGSKKRKADDTTDPRPAKRQSTSRKVDPPSAKPKSTAGDGGRSQKKRKRQDDSDSDEPTPKSRSKQALDAAKSRFEMMHDRLRALAKGKSGSITTKLPPSMCKGPPGIRPGTVEFKALNLKGMDEDSDEDRFFLARFCMVYGTDASGMTAPTHRSPGLMVPPTNRGGIEPSMAPLLEGADGDYEKSILEAQNLIDVVMAVTGIIYRVKRVEVHVCAPFTSMPNLANNAIFRNLGVYVDELLSCGVSPVLEIR